MIRLAVVLMLLASAGARAQSADFCAYGQATAVLLVDRTTVFDKTDTELFLDALNGIVAGLHAGDRLVAFTMTGAYTESRKVFDQCKPGCPEQGFFSGLLATCRPVLARAQYQGFMRTLAETLAGLLRDREQTAASDLFRTVAEVTRAYAAGPQPLRTVVLFSDLLENSALLPERELRRLPPAEVLKRLAAADIAARVGGAQVRVFGFGRDDGPARAPLPQDQRRRVEAAWRGWLLAGGAASVEIGFR